MAKVFQYQTFRKNKTLVPNKTLRVGGLAITFLKSERSNRDGAIWNLEIENKTRNYLAYNVSTRVLQKSKFCRKKESLKHNAVVLKPRSKILRSECVFKGDLKVKVLRVETMQVPEISYFYLSAMSPSMLALDKRTSKGHQSPVTTFVCNKTSSVSLEKAIKRKEVTWRDLVDFYARHRCSSYSYVKGYKAFEKDGELPLPAVQER